MLKTNISFYRKSKIAVVQTMQNAFGFVIFIIMLITGCATTNINSVWKDQSYQIRPNKIMIIAISKKQTNKNILENEFVRQIKMLGTDAVASYTILTNDKDSNKEVIAAKMKEVGADAVLITRLASKKTLYTHISTNEFSPPDYYSTWDDYYGYGYQIVNSPDYIEENEYAIMETNLYDAGHNKLVWSASSETEIYASAPKSIKSYVNAIVKQMVKQNLLKQ